MRAFLAASLVALLLGSAAPAAELTVGSGASFDLGTGVLGLGCADLTVGGTLSSGTAGFVMGRDVTIAPGGTLDGNSATLQLSGSWDNDGIFNAGTSTVEIVDGCGLLSGTIFGNTTFAGLSIMSTSARQQAFEAGSTTNVTGVLTLAGQSGALLAIRSTAGGSPAFLNVLGASSAGFVDVDDNDATGGNEISLGPESVKGSNTPGWKLVALVPALGALGLGVLGLSLLGTGLRALAASRQR